MTTRREFMVGVSGLTFSILLEGLCSKPVKHVSAAGHRSPRHRGRARKNCQRLGKASPRRARSGSSNPAVEMARGSQTAIPLIIAEEMDADWSRVVIVPAAPDDKVYGNPASAA